MGIGVGLSASPSAAALVEFSAPGQSARASAIATAATALGLALAVLVGGALIQYAPYKMHFNFWVLTAVIAMLFVATWFLPRATRGNEATRWRPSAITVPKGILVHFIASATAVTAAYALGAIMLALGAQIARELIGSNNALVNGSALAFFAAVSGVVAIMGKRFAARPNIVAGGIAAAMGMALLMFAAKTQSLVVFLLAQGFDGAAYSLLFLGGLTLINLHAPVHQRGASISAIYLIGYLFMGLIALGIGMTATAFGLQTALDYGAPLIAFIGLAATALSSMKPRTRGLAGALG
jgi:MFS family permease